jgi:hypothetical protein
MKLNGLAILFVLAAFNLGCPSQKQAPAPDSQPKKKSTGQTAIEGVTGKTAVDAGRRAQKTIDRISTQRDQDFDEIVAEEE